MLSIVGQPLILTSYVTRNAPQDTADLFGQHLTFGLHLTFEDPPKSSEIHLV